MHFSLDLEQNGATAALGDSPKGKSHGKWRRDHTSRTEKGIMSDYESPSITELGTITDLTRGTGNDRGFDSAYGWGAFFGFFDKSGGPGPSGSAG